MFLHPLCVLQYDYEYDEHGERVVLGKGTFGVVYAGRDLSNQVRLAIKEIPERDSRWGSAMDDNLECDTTSYTDNNNRSINLL